MASETRFYVSERALRSWERVAEMSYEHRGREGILARALLTLIEAYRLAVYYEDSPLGNDGGSE